MEVQKIIDRAMEIRKLYEAEENQLYGSAWTGEEIALGFVGDVGDLAKLIIAENGKRDIANSNEKLGHELADCLWSLIVLSKIGSLGFAVILLYVGAKTLLLTGCHPHIWGVSRQLPMNAKIHGIDLEKTFMDTMDELEQRLLRNKFTLGS